MYLNKNVSKNFSPFLKAEKKDPFGGLDGILEIA